MIRKRKETLSLESQMSQLSQLLLAHSLSSFCDPCPLSQVAQLSHPNEARGNCQNRTRLPYHFTIKEKLEIVKRAHNRVEQTMHRGVDK